MGTGPLSRGRPSLCLQSPTAVVTAGGRGYGNGTEGSRVRVGVLGGTFDPIHYGHLMLARRAQQACALDQLLLVPAAAHPGKPAGHGASAAQRLALVHLAVADSAWLTVCDHEIASSTPVYTIDTLRWLAGQHRAAFTLVMGADVVMRLPRWRAAAELITLADIAVAPRPGCRWSPAELERQLPGISTRICELPGPALSISSQRVRQAIAAGQPIDDLVPTPVAHAIAAMGLYRLGAVPTPDG